MHFHSFLIMTLKLSHVGFCTSLLILIKYGFTGILPMVYTDFICHPFIASIPSNFYGYSTTNVLVWLPVEKIFYLYQALPCVFPADVEVFVDPLSNETCIAIANEVHIDKDFNFHTILPSYIYCLESLEKGFYLKDSIITIGANKV